MDEIIIIDDRVLQAINVSRLRFVFYFPRVVACARVKRARTAPLAVQDFNIPV